MLRTRSLVPRPTTGFTTCLVCALAALAGPGRAVAQMGGPVGPMAGMARWEPLSAPTAGRPLRFGAWSGLVAGYWTTAYMRETGPRGDEGVFNLSMLAFRVARPVGPGFLGVRLMVSAEPSMGAEGYPHLLQTGESADGATPLYDRQHPHDLFTELALAYSFPVDSTFSVSLYVAPVGDPAFGPGPYMMRTSGRDLPRAPISHHLFDGAHITYGVATLVLVSPGKARLEVSAFNGREPDERRWNVEKPRIDSYSVRLTALLGRHLSAQGSLAQVSSPERLHPGIDVTRLSLSATYDRPLGRATWQTTAAFARSKTARTTIPIDRARREFSQPVLDHYLSLIDATGLPEDSFLLYFPVRTQRAWMLESSLSLAPLALAARFERVSKAELFPPEDARHSTLYDVAKIEASVSLDVLRTPVGRMSVGLAGAVSLVPRELREEYGGRPRSWIAFGRLAVR